MAGQIRRINNQGDTVDAARVEIASSPNFSAALGLPSVCVEKRHWVQIGEDSPDAAPLSEVRKLSVCALNSGG